MKLILRGISTLIAALSIIYGLSITAYLLARMLVGDLGAGLARFRRVGSLSAGDGTGADRVAYR
jgi:hypothetical protein